MIQALLYAAVFLCLTWAGEARAQTSATDAKKPAAQPQNPEPKTPPPTPIAPKPLSAEDRALIRELELIENAELLQNLELFDKRLSLTPPRATPSTSTPRDGSSPSHSSP